jgi:hypothetical protein
VAAVAFKNSLRFIPFSINPPFKNEKVSLEKSRYIFFEKQSELKRPQRNIQNPLGAFEWILLEPPFHNCLQKPEVRLLGCSFTGRKPTMPKYQNPLFGSTTKLQRYQAKNPLTPLRSIKESLRVSERSRKESFSQNQGGA